MKSYDIIYLSKVGVYCMGIIYLVLSQFLGLLLLVFAIIPIIITFKLTRNYSEKKKFVINMFSIAFFIPFSNFIIALIALLCNAKESTIMSLSYFFGFSWLFFLLPIGFLIIAVLPIKIFSYKKFTLLTILLTFCIGWIMLFAFLRVEKLIENINLAKELDEYKVTIEYITSYKNKYKIYPTTINKHLKPIRALSHYEYKTINNGNDFRLNVRDELKHFPNYSYCSNIEISGCNDNDESPFVRSYFHHWVKEEFIRD